MTPTDLAERLEKITTQASQKLEAKVITTQNQLEGQVIGILKDLEVDKDGYIVQSQANRKIIQKASNAFEAGIKNSPYFDGIQQYVNSIPLVDKANSAYFDFISQGYKPNAQYITSLKKDTIKSLESLLMQDGLESQIKAPLVNILNQNINSSAKFTDLLKSVQQYIVGTNQLDGKLLSYSKQITSDALFNYSRGYQQAVTSDLGLEWYLYAGGVTEGGKFSGGSRGFCISKIGNYYDHDDVERWANSTWEGQRRGTNSSTIFIYAGGYNCRHSIIPVSENAVPKTNKDAKKLGKEAKSAGGELDATGKRIANKYNAKITPINYKGYESMVRKANDELGGRIYADKVGSGIKDSVRNTIITDKDNLKNVVGAVGSEKIIIGEVKVQNYVSSGYRGYLANVKLSNGTIGEIQINTPEMIFAKEEPKIARMVIGEAKWNEINKRTGLPGGLGHKYYEESRVIKKDNPNYEKLIEDISKKSRDYYSKFYYSYPDKWP